MRKNHYNLGFSSGEVRIRVVTFFCKGNLQPKKGKKALLGDLVIAAAPHLASRALQQCTVLGASIVLP